MDSLDDLNENKKLSLMLINFVQYHISLSGTAAAQAGTSWPIAAADSIMV